MARTEQEQELVLGNKQLLSAFFVVVALLGVFFTAGYIIGRNTGAKTSSTEAGTDASPNTGAAQRTADKVVETVPAAAPPPTAPEKKVEQALPEPPVTKPVVEKKPEPEPVGAVATQVTPGHQYLQLMAVKRPMADSMVKLLKGRGYPALLGESSKPELFRVLVGPFTDTAPLSKTKNALKAAGFDSVIAK